MGSEKYPALFSGTLEYALSPHARRPIFASSVGINYGDVARNWVAMQIKTIVLDNSRMHFKSLAENADIFARTFAMMGSCHFRLYNSQTKAEERVDIWRLINEQRMERYE